MVARDGGWRETGGAGGRVATAVATCKQGIKHRHQVMHECRGEGSAGNQVQGEMGGVGVGS